MKIKFIELFLIALLFHTGCSNETGSGENLSSQTRESASLNKEVMRGRHVFEDGTIYEGELVLGKPNGFGTRVVRPVNDEYSSSGP